MMRLASILFLLSLITVQAVEYPFLGAGVTTNGWVIMLTNATAPNLDATTAANTNLQFFNGFLTNNTPSSTNGLIVTWTDMGYSGSTAIEQYSFAYGTKLLREVYPMQNTNLVRQSEVTNAVSHIALSRNIPASASNIVAWIRAGAIASTNGSAFTNCMATNIAVALNSVQLYTRIGGNWSPGVPMFSRVTNTMRLRAVGFHSSANNRRPVELIRFITTGLTSGVKVTNDVQVWSIDHAFNRRATFPKQINPAEAIADVDLSGMTALENVVSDLQMFAARGSIILDTTTDTFPIGHPRECKLLNKYDPNSAHSRVVFVVDNVNGSDVNGRSRTNVAPTDIATGEYFLTAGAAFINAAASNNTFYGHNDTSGVIGYNKSGTTNYPGSNLSGAAITIPVVAPIMRPYPGDTVKLTHVIAASSASMKRIKFEGINTEWAAATVPFTSYGYLGFDQCSSLVSTSTAPIQTTTNVIITHSTIGWFAQGLKAVAPQNTAFSVRGCWLNGFNQNISFRTFIGNFHGTTNEGASYAVNAGFSGDLSPDGNRISYNNFYSGQNAQAGSTILGVISNVNDSLFIVQDVYEKCRGGEPVASIASTTAAGVAYTNVGLWACLLEGGRIADYASDSGSLNIPHIQFSAIGTIWSYPGQKDDDDTPFDANRIGAWEPDHMVNGRGNFYIRNNVSSATTSFRPRFSGLNTYESGVTNVDNFMRFTDRKAGIATTATEGNSNFRLLSDSPAFKLRFENPLPFDIEGRPTSRFGPPGPYAAGDRRRGMM